MLNQRLLAITEAARRTLSTPPVMVCAWSLDGCLRPKPGPLSAELTHGICDSCKAKAFPR